MKRNKSILALLLASTMILGSGCSTTGSAPAASKAPASATPAAASAAPASAAATPAASATTTAAKKVIHVNNTEEPGSLNPQLASGTHDSWAINHMIRGLYTSDPSGVPTLAMASAAKTSADGLTWTFTLRDAKWSNGDPVIASDFVKAWLFGMDPKNAAKYAEQLYIVKGAEAFNKGKAAVDTVGLSAPDDKTFVVQLVSPVAYLPDLLTGYCFMPVDQKNATANPDWYKSAKNYVSNGPYVLTDWQSKKSLTLSRNVNYYDNSKTKIDEIDMAMVNDQTTEWQMYQDGQLDLVYDGLPDVNAQLVKAKDPTITIAPSLATYYYLFNCNKKPFNNVKVRTALTMAINRKIITDNITQTGQMPAYSMTPPNVPDETGKDFQASLGGAQFKEDIAAAKTMLAEGLKEEGIDQKTWSFSILYNTSDTHKKIAEAIQNMWATNLGVNCKLENADFQVVLDRRSKGDFDVARAGWVGDYVDPLTFLDMFTKDNSLNDGKYNNPAYDKLIADSKTEIDVAKRMGDLRNAEKLLMKDMPVAPIYWYTTSTVINPKITGVYVPIDAMPRFEFADIKS